MPAWIIGSALLNNFNSCFQSCLNSQQFFQKKSNVCEMARKGVKETYPQSMRGIKNPNNRERAENQKDPTPKFRQKDAEESLHCDVAKDCLLTLVKSRLALGSPGCRLFVTMPKMAQ